MVAPDPTRVIIFATAALYCAAWRALLAEQPDLIVIGTVAHPSELIAFPQIGLPTTVLLDLLTPPADLIRQCKAINTTFGLLVLVPAYDLEHMLVLLGSGATGCLARDATVGDLARAIIAVGRGEIVLPPTLAARALAAFARGEPVQGTLAVPLSEREMEVLRLLAAGLTNKDIAQSLLLSVRTIEAHLRSIFVKLNVRSRTEAALWAVNHGYGPEQ